jgi:D-inositol-3-phosphate glycosyltransferase
MNVYVRELSASLARAGHDVDIYTRRDHPHQTATEVVEPGLRVHHVTAGPATNINKDDLRSYLDDFSREVARLFRVHRPDVIHAHYWMSAVAGHQLKHEFNLPLFVTFHTLERVKAETFEVESESRGEAEEAIIGCADVVFASGDTEAQQIMTHYRASRARIATLPLGVDHAIFAPGDRGQARCASHLAVTDPLVLYVGRLQRLKGVDLALESFIELRQRGHRAHLAIIGGPSGPSGAETLRNIHQRISETGLVGDVSLVAPQSHVALSTWYRAANVTVMPSRAESFGLVALESQACGTPVVASRIGGLPLIVHDHITGRLMDSRDPAEWADALWDTIENGDALAAGAVQSARIFTWSTSARIVADLAVDIRARRLLDCLA